jgi:hypothetical protein
MWIIFGESERLLERTEFEPGPTTISFENAE